MERARRLLAHLDHTPASSPTVKPAACGWVTVAVEPDDCVKPRVQTMRGKRVVITGGTRGIGLEIGKRLASEGAHVALLGKTTEAHSALEGTIHTAAAEINAQGGRAIGVRCDVRDDASVRAAIDQVARELGGIDIVVNNASAIALTGTLATSMKRFDLMMGVDGRGTFLVSQTCLPLLLDSAKQGRNPHVLTISPPLAQLDARWVKDNTAYAIAKYSMSMCSLGMAEEFRKDGVAFNSLWPRTAVATAAVKNLLGGEPVAKLSRTPRIMADAALCIVASDAATCTGKFFIDDVVLMSTGVTLMDMERLYTVTPGTHSGELAPDFFC